MRIITIHLKLNLMKNLEIPIKKYFVLTLLCILCNCFLSIAQTQTFKHITNGSGAVPILLDLQNSKSGINSPGIQFDTRGAKLNASSAPVNASRILMRMEGTNLVFRARDKSQLLSWNGNTGYMVNRIYGIRDNRTVLGLQGPNIGLELIANKNGKPFIDFTNSNHSRDFDARLTMINDDVMSLQGARLNVKNGIFAGNIEVKPANQIPDYVFKAGYELMTLEDLALFVKKNHHLPNIPSETDILKKGSVDVGAMQLKLLEKIEELTLYLIEQDKEIKELRKGLQNQNGVE